MKKLILILLLCCVSIISYADGVEYEIVAYRAYNENSYTLTDGHVSLKDGYLFVFNGTDKLISFYKIVSTQEVSSVKLILEGYEIILGSNGEPVDKGPRITITVKEDTIRNFITWQINLKGGYIMLKTKNYYNIIPDNE